MIGNSRPRAPKLIPKQRGKFLFIFCAHVRDQSAHHPQPGAESGVAQTRANPSGYCAHHFSQILPEGGQQQRNDRAQPPPKAHRRNPFRVGTAVRKFKWGLGAFLKQRTWGWRMSYLGACLVFAAGLLWSFGAMLPKGNQDT